MSNNVIKNRYDFVILFDVENGNPNGDPDAGNMPRVDIETGHGLITNGCLKRKIRNYIHTVKENDPRYRIYIQQDAPLNQVDAEIVEYLGISDNLADAKKADPNLDINIRDAMCVNFFDIRAFGGVMTTFVKAKLGCGQINGPVQVVDARSVDPILTQEVTITRMAVNTEKDFADNKRNEIGRKYIVPYGLYRAEGFISANLARKVTHFNEDDLALLWEAILNMFEHDRSAARGKMVVRELIIFKHDSELGNAPAHKLFDLVKVQRNEGVIAPRAYSDYTVIIDDNKIPAGVECIHMG